jgi:hypothetical protein
LWGYADSTGTLILDAIYQSAGPMEQGRAKVKLPGWPQFVIIDAHGKVIQTVEEDFNVSSLRDDVQDVLYEYGNYLFRDSLIHSKDTNLQKLLRKLPVVRYTKINHRYGHDFAFFDKETDTIFKQLDGLHPDDVILCQSGIWWSYLVMQWNGRSGIKNVYKVGLMGEVRKLGTTMCTNFGDEFIPLVYFHNNPGSTILSWQWLRLGDGLSMEKYEYEWPADTWQSPYRVVEKDKDSSLFGKGNIHYLVNDKGRRKGPKYHDLIALNQIAPNLLMTFTNEYDYFLHHPNGRKVLRKRLSSVALLSSWCCVAHSSDSFYVLVYHNNKWKRYYSGTLTIKDDRDRKRFTMYNVTYQPERGGLSFEHFNGKENETKFIENPNAPKVKRVKKEMDCQFKVENKNRENFLTGPKRFEPVRVPLNYHSYGLTSKVPEYVGSGVFRINSNSEYFYFNSEGVVFWE